MATEASSDLCNDQMAADGTSPVVTAAYQGNLDTVRYLLENCGGSPVDINHEARQDTKHLINPIRRCFDWSMQNRLTSLGAACLSNNLELVKYLISKGADIHRQASGIGPALTTAVYHGHLPIIKYLVECAGSDINETNLTKTNFPLICALLGFGEQDVLRYLLERRVDLYQKTYRGHTALHIVSFETDNFQAVQLLLDHGMSPMFAVASASDVPCPLYLAAVKKNFNIVNHFIERPDCPPLCRAEAYLIAGSAHMVNTDREIELLTRGLTYLKECPSEPVYLSPLEEYGYRTEMTTVEELEAIRHDYKEMMFQSLLIMERCCGIVYSRTTICISISVQYLLAHGHYKECNGLMRRLMFAIECFFDDLKERPSVIFLSFLTSWTRQYIRSLGKHQPESVTDIDFSLLVDFHLMILNRLVMDMQTSSGIEKDVWETYRNVMEATLMTLFYWYRTAVRLSSNEEISKVKQLVQRLLKTYLRYPPGSTLLHLVVGAINSEIKGEFFGQLLSWGLDEVINYRCGSGNRPLHEALCFSGSANVVSVLLYHGAHIDAVDADNRTAFELCTKNSPIYDILIASGPLPLSCHAAKVIVTERLPYDNLPKHIIQLIKLHEP